MKKKLPLVLILMFTILVGVLHFAGSYLYLYWRLDNYDKLVHLSGGFLVALMCLVIIYFNRMPDVKTSHLLAVGFAGALAIGIAWEIFELQAHITAFSDANYWFDNGGDVVFDIIGGIIGTGYFIRKYKTQK